MNKFIVETKAYKSKTNDDYFGMEEGYLLRSESGKTAEVWDDFGHKLCTKKIHKDFEGRKYVKFEGFNAIEHCYLVY